MKVGTKAWLEHELGLTLMKLKRTEKEADIACQALHEYRDILSVLQEDLSPESIAYKFDLRPVAAGREATGKRALEALKKMPLAEQRRYERYEEEQIDVMELGLSKGMPLVRKKLLTKAGWTPPCGDEDCPARPRTVFIKGQFQCLVCEWRSDFDEAFIKTYMSTWL